MWLPWLFAALFVAAVARLLWLELRVLPGIEQRKNAAVRWLFRHHHNRPEGDRLYAQVLRQVIDERYPRDRLARAVTHANYINNPMAKALVAATEQVMCGAAEHAYTAGLDVIAAQTPGQPKEHQP